MVRKANNDLFQVECSHCKRSNHLAVGVTEAIAIKNAESFGFAVIGKFQFCHECLIEMLERWKINNREIIKDVL